MKTPYHQLKHAVALPLLALAGYVMRESPELSTYWYAGLGLVLLVAAAYVFEEFVWIAKRKGRPCGNCGALVPMKSFRLQTSCPQCGKPY